MMQLRLASPTADTDIGWVKGMTDFLLQGLKDLAQEFPREISVRRSLGMGLDEKAVEAVRRWKFDPAKKDGQAVAVQISIEVNFRLY